MQTLAPPRREWRKLVKKLQRKKRRQKAAKERDKLLEAEAAAKLKDPAYQEQQKQLAEQERIKDLEEERKHNDEEEAWLRRELIAQRQFRLDRQRREAEEAAKEASRKEAEKELEERKEKQRKYLEEKARLEAESAAEFESMMLRADAYLTDSELETPRELKRVVHSRPGEKLCKSYENTNFCRFGSTCIYDHRRPILSRIVLIHHFFSHPLLESSENPDSVAAADAHSESSERDLRDDYDSFFDDVVPELESFGRIRTFATLRNVLPHLRGNVFVEYEDKRSALRAFIKLQGRYYAMKRLIVEFSNLLTWRAAVCETVNNRPNPNQIPSVRAVNQGIPLISWNDIGDQEQTAHRRNWRWSESPEIEISVKPSSPKGQFEEVKAKESKHYKERSKSSPSREKHGIKRLDSERSSKNSEERKTERKHKRRHSSDRAKTSDSRKEKEKSKAERKTKRHKKHRKKSKKSKS